MSLFDETFQVFIGLKNTLKIVYVATANEEGVPNSAPKMLVDVVAPNIILFIDYPFTQTYGNMMRTGRFSLSFMDDTNFLGYRFTGKCEALQKGEEFEDAKKIWDKRVIHYEAERIATRVAGGHSASEAELQMSEDFVIVKAFASETSLVKPARIFRAQK